MAELKIEGAGLVIKALREKHGLSLSELAGRLDWDKSRLSLYENDKRSISLETLAEFCLALNEPPMTVIRDCIKPVHASAVGSMLQDLVRETKMEGPATISMIMCSGVSAAEQARLEALDHQVSQILLTRTTNRHFWIGREEKGERRVELHSIEGVAFSIDSTEFAAISDHELLKRIAKKQL